MFITLEQREPLNREVIELTKEYVLQRYLLFLHFKLSVCFAFLMFLWSILCSQKPYAVGSFDTLAVCLLSQPRWWGAGWICLQTRSIFGFKGDVEKTLHGHTAVQQIVYLSSMPYAVVTRQIHYANSFLKTYNSKCWDVDSYCHVRRGNAVWTCD